MSLIKTILILEPIPAPSKKSILFGFLLMGLGSLFFLFQYGSWIFLGISTSTVLWHFLSPKSHMTVLQILRAILAHILHWVLLVLLCVIFYLIVTPMGLFARILNRDLLHLRKKSMQKTYRIKSEPLRPNFEKQQF